MQFDFVVVGAGMAGLSAAAALAAHGKVLVLEQEEQPAYHSTGRSAALFTLAYGSSAIGALARCSRPLFDNPPEGFDGQPLLTPRTLLMVSTADKHRFHIEGLKATRAAGGDVHEVPTAEALRLLPVLRDEAAVHAFVCVDTFDIDIDGLQTGFLRQLRARGGRLETDAGVVGLSRKNGVWEAETRAGTFRAPIVVNAAGAWADTVAELAGARPLGLVPKRRTAILFDGADGDIAGWPMAVASDEAWYFKPDAGKLLASPADETPSPPCDAQPEDLDVAVCVDRIETATRLKVNRISHKLAGLRTFSADRNPVCGFDPERPGFFWLAGQGGYGIKTAPGLAAMTESLITEMEPPQAFIQAGVATADLSPRRLI